MKTLLTIVFVLCSVVTMAAERWLPGTVESFDGSRQSGFMLYEDWHNNPDSIFFKPTMDADTTTLGLNDIRSFEVGPEKYVKATFEVDYSPTTPDLMNNSPIPITSKETHFIRVLVSGALSLYEFKYAGGVEAFYLQQSDEYVLLVNKPYKFVENGKTETRYHRGYKHQINGIVTSCGKGRKIPEDTRYIARHFIKIVLDHNKCLDQEVAFFNKLEAATTSTTFLAGATATWIEFYTRRHYPFITEVDYNHSIRHTWGIGLEVKLPSNRGKWSVNNEFLIGGYTFRRTYQEYYNENYYTNFDITLDYRFLRVQNMLRYRVYLDRSIYFFNFGLANSFGFLQVNRLIEAEKFFIREREYHRHLIGYHSNGSRGHEIALQAGFGYELGRFRSEFRYHISRGPSRIPEIRTRTHTLFLMLGWRLSKV